MTGRSLELFYVDGDPGGLLTAEVFGWTGHVIRVPRLRLRDGLAMPEADHTGVYLLLGDRDGVQTAYVGEAEAVASRIRQHDSGKDWWSEALILTTSSDALHKAHAKYLESRLLEEARQADNVRLDNGNVPPRASLNRAAVASMEAFLGTFLMILPALGVSLFQSGRRQADGAAEQAGAPEFVLRTPKHGVEGRARLKGSDFVVLAGSIARRSWGGKGDHDFGYRALHAQLVSLGVLVQTDTHAVFQEDYAFRSPSAAAAVMNGRPANGRIEWKTDDGQTFADWEAAQLQ